MACIYIPTLKALKHIQRSAEGWELRGFKVWNHSAHMHPLVVNPDSGFSVGTVLGANLLSHVLCRLGSEKLLVTCLLSFSSELELSSADCW